MKPTAYDGTTQAKIHGKYDNNPTYCKKVKMVTKI